MNKKKENFVKKKEKSDPIIDENLALWSLEYQVPKYQIYNIIVTRHF